MQFRGFPAGFLTRILPAFVASALAVGLPEGTARADGVLLSRFDPADRGSRFFYADSLELGRRDPADPRPLVTAGVTSSFARTTTTWGNHREGKRATLMESALWVHPGASVTIHPGVRFGLDVPVAAYQMGEDTNLDGSYYPAPSSPRIGDVRGSFEMILLGSTSSEGEGRGTDGLALAAGVTAWLPTGSAASYAGDDFTRFGLHASARWRFPSALVTIRAGYMYRRDAQLGGSVVGPELNATAGAAWLYQGLTIGPEVTMAGTLDADFAKRSTPVEALLGGHADLGAGLRAGAGIGTALVRGLGAADVRIVLSLEWVGPDADRDRDRDGDGIPDRLDMCPDVRGDAAGRGCPNAPMVPDVAPVEPSSVPEMVPPPIVEPPVAEPPPDPPTKPETP